MLDKNDVEQLKEIFVTRKECEEKEEKQELRFSGEIRTMRDDMIALKTRLNVLIGILSAIAVPVLTIAINYFLKR